MGDRKRSVYEHQWTGDDVVLARSGDGVDGAGVS